MSEARPRVVVGVDGSEESVEALCWAIGYARRTGGTVCAVMAWQPPPVYAYASYGGVFPAIPDGPGAPELAELTQQALAALVTDLMGDSLIPVIEQVAVQGHPASVLIEQSASADLLAVGARGHSAFTELLLGSVSTHCLHRAACPVLVVRRHAASGGKEGNGHADR